jgi:UDP-glucuronate 4-epimerase
MILVTGAAGFIGFHVAAHLLEEGRDVIGVDTINSYYDPALKRARLEALSANKRFRFAQIDIAEAGALERAAPVSDVTHIIHLAAQPGVRYSLEAPFAYEHANVRGHLSVLEYARAGAGVKHLIYASSSSVYGDRSDGPFLESDRCDEPASLYAATKKACELMSYTYAHLYGVKATGLRFFTVYGPWGRPDMSAWLFTEKVLRGEPLTLFGAGRYLRDFTYIDDVSAAIMKLVDLPPEGTPPHEIYNIGNSRPTMVLDFVTAIEKATGRTAQRILAAPLKTEVAATFADHSRASARFGFSPATTIEEGVPRFVAWYRARYGV